MKNTTSSVSQIIKDTIDNSTIVTKSLNPIVPIDYSNDTKTVDILLTECEDLIDTRYKPWFAKRFYKLEKYSVLNAAKLARLEGHNPQRFFSNMLKEVAN